MLHNYETADLQIIFGHLEGLCSLLSIALVPNPLALMALQSDTRSDGDLT